ncbi:hypothetical protein FGIG_03879 [Fasciola gigantica]|uniref:Integrase p58-like C-terminal domain-containing protein n=1 Tax=Fasciola gigantica TaxID=46835 RepID=A0A504YP12_FASGI|nr:hypothetical protein FGIG_03879 [Fasciola gigantica]
MFARIPGISADFDRAVATFHDHGRELWLPVDLTVPRLADDIRTSTDYAIKPCQTLGDSHRLARTHLRTSQRHQKEFYDRKAHGTPVQPGEEVWMKPMTQVPEIPSKFKYDWTGPFIVIETLSPTTCRVARVGENPETQSQIVHYNRLKPAAHNDGIVSSRPPGFPCVAEAVEVHTEGLRTALPREGAV